MAIRESAVPERTSWRDEELSKWHRAQHRMLAMTDLDFVCLEYRWNNPVALIDYKKMRPMKLGTSGPLQAINQLANIAHLPFFIVFYEWDPTVFTVWPENKNARDLVPAQTEMSEREYVEFLFRIGNHTPEEVWLRDLSTVKRVSPNGVPFGFSEFATKTGVR